MAATAEESSLTLLTLPEELVEKILSYLTYEEISENRRVCHLFDQKCHRLLNQGFSHVDKYHGQIQKSIKTQLPRRESERRNHPLARHVDILAAIETRLSLLNMTYMKYIDSGLCCFIPGKVLDEVFRVLTYIKNNPTPPRAHELLQELRDISSMAMEQFEEKIVPILKSKMPTMQLSLNSAFPPLSTSFSPGFSGSPMCTMSVHHKASSSQKLEVMQLRQSLRNTNSALTSLKKELNDLKLKLSEQKHRVGETDKKLLEQNRVIHEQNRKLSTQDKLISDLNKKILGYDQKFEDIITELVRVRQGTPSELGGSCSSLLLASPEKSRSSTVNSARPLPDQAKQTSGAKSKRGVKRSAKRRLEDKGEDIETTLPSATKPSPYNKRLRSKRKCTSKQ